MSKNVKSSSPIISEVRRNANLISSIIVFIKNSEVLTVLSKLRDEVTQG